MLEYHLHLPPLTKLFKKEDASPRLLLNLFDLSNIQFEVDDHLRDNAPYFIFFRSPKLGWFTGLPLESPSEGDVITRAGSAAGLLLRKVTPSSKSNCEWSEVTDLKPMFIFFKW